MSDGEDFDELYRSSRDRLATQVGALTGDSSEAKDFVQEAFIRAWTRWDRISSYDDPEAWVRRVAYQLAIGRWRRSRKIHLRSEISSDDSNDPGESIGVIDALQTLPVAERQAIVLHHVGGLSVEETAHEMSAPVGTVKSWLSRGRLRLASELDNAAEDDHVKG